MSVKLNFFESGRLIHSCFSSDHVPRVGDHVQFLGGPIRKVEGVLWVMDAAAQVNLIVRTIT